MSIGLKVPVFVSNELIVETEVADEVFEVIMVFVSADEGVDVFDTVIDDVGVLELRIVFVNPADFEDDVDPVGVLEIPVDLDKDADDDDVLELRCEDVEQGELVEVFDDDIDPVVVFVLIDVLDNKAEDDTVDVLLDVNVSNGHAVDVRDVVDVLVDVLVLVELPVGILVLVN